MSQADGSGGEAALLGDHHEPEHIVQVFAIHRFLPVLISDTDRCMWI